MSTSYKDIKTKREIDMQVYEVTEQLMGYHDKLTDYADKASLWQDEVKETLTKLEANFTSIDEMLQAMHEAQRIHQVFTAGLENSQDFLDELDGRPGFRMWEEIAEPPADRALQGGSGLHDPKADHRHRN